MLCDKYDQQSNTTQPHAPTTNMKDLSTCLSGFRYCTFVHCGLSFFNAPLNHWLLYIAGNSKIPIIEPSFLSNPRFPSQILPFSTFTWLCCCEQIMENRYWRPYSRRRSEEFQEEDVWNVIKDNRQVGIRIDESNSNAPTSPLSISRRLPSAARMIPGPHKTAEHSDSTDALKLLQHSAPVSIPDWPKIYRQSPKRKDDVIDDHIHGGVDESDDDDEEEEEDDDDGESLPPHEWLARKNARSKVSSFSVCEGAGRTLKGRDLCRVRNAILSKTGFI